MTIIKLFNPETIYRIDAPVYLIENELLANMGLVFLLRDEINQLENITDPAFYADKLQFIDYDYFDPEMEYFVIAEEEEVIAEIESEPKTTEQPKVKKTRVRGKNKKTKN